jgi:hypothetical protein
MDTLRNGEKPLHPEITAACMSKLMQQDMPELFFTHRVEPRCGHPYLRSE